MKLSLDVTPDLAAILAAEVKAGERAVTTAVRDAGRKLRDDWRGQIRGSGLGDRLARSIRLDLFPRGRDSISTAALVYSRASRVVAAHEAGPLIRSRDGFFLAIPTEAAGRGRGGARITPAEWERRRGLRLRLVYRRNAPSLLVAEARVNTRGLAQASRSKTGRGVATVPIFILVPQVRLRKRLDLARDADRAAAALPGAIVNAWVDRRL